MSNDFERQWAVAMKKAKIKASQTKSTPLDKQKTKNSEEILYYKNSLRSAYAQKDQSKIETILKILIELRVTQAGLKIQELEQYSGSISEYSLKKIIKKCAHDCARLVKTLSTSL